MKWKVLTLRCPATTLRYFPKCPPNGMESIFVASGWPFEFITTELPAYVYDRAYDEKCRTYDVDAHVFVEPPFVLRFFADPPEAGIMSGQTLEGFGLISTWLNTEKQLQPH